MEETIKFINEVIAAYNERMKDQPYQFNLLEEVHMHDDEGDDHLSRMKENAHSRILRSILAYQIDGEPLLLKSLINYIASIYPDSNWKSIRINTPKTPETEKATDDGRIDLFVEEPGKYAIIFENKINLSETGDQPNQLARYILYEQNCGYSENQIFVVYLTSDGHEPSIQSWTDPHNDNNCFRDRFQPRYANLSYKKHILDWLKTCACPLVNKLEKEKLLSSALYQYVNYLEMKYKQRNIDLMKNEDIKKALGFTTKDNNNTQLSLALSRLDKIVEVEKDLTDLIKEFLHCKFPKLHEVEKDVYKKIRPAFIDAAFSFLYNNLIFYVVLYRYDSGNTFYCGIFAPKKETIPDNLQSHFEFLTPDKRNSPNSLYSKPLAGYSNEMVDRVFTTANEIAE